MADTDAEYIAGLISRTIALRIRRKLNKKRMAAALGVPYDTYRQYEKRSPLPHQLIGRFAAIVDEDPGYVLTGQRPVRSAPSAPIETPETPQPNPVTPKRGARR